MRTVHRDERTSVSITIHTLFIYIAKISVTSFNEAELNIISHLLYSFYCILYNIAKLKCEKVFGRGGGGFADYFLNITL
jgi:hypothetical protein